MGCVFGPDGSYGSRSRCLGPVVHILGGLRRNSSYATTTFGPWGLRPDITSSSSGLRQPSSKQLYYSYNNRGCPFLKGVASTLYTIYRFHLRHHDTRIEAKLSRTQSMVDRWCINRRAKARSIGSPIYEDLKLRKRRRRRSMAPAGELLLSNLQVTFYASPSGLCARKCP